MALQPLRGAALLQSFKHSNGLVLYLPSKMKHGLGFVTTKMSLYYCFSETNNY